MSHSKYLKVFNRSPLFLLSTILLLGCFLRFIHLESKIFWVDEVATAVRVSGYTVTEVANSLLSSGIVNRDILLLYQTTDSAKTFSDSFEALTKSPEHAPLYFLLTRLWMQWWGNSIAVMRSLSASLSLLIFPCLYWLCRELFKEQLVGWLGVMLMEVSPFYVAYAQEARPYSLWTVAILLMSASFLRALRINSRWSWSLYSCCLVLGFYTSLFSIYVALFYGIYLLLVFSKKRIKLIKRYINYSAIALLAFLPWIIVIVSNFTLLSENTSWMRGNFNLADIVAVYIGTNLLVFGDLPISSDSDPIQTATVLIALLGGLFTGLKLYPHCKTKLAKFALTFSLLSFILLLSSFIYLDWTTIIGAIVALGILSISVYSVYYLIINTTSDRWLFIACLMLSLPLPLLVTDLINQGQSSTAPRYLIPFQLGILIAVSYTLANKLTAIKTKTNNIKFWRLVLAALLTLGIFSCIRNLNLSPFYQKGRNINNPAIAKIINRHSYTLVVVETDEAMDVLSLAYSLNPEVKYRVITPEENIDRYRDRFKNIYILKPSEHLKQRLEKTGINIQQVYRSQVFSADEFPLDLWQIEN